MSNVAVGQIIIELMINLWNYLMEGISDLTKAVLVKG